jgi:hypothetical protein
MYADLKRNPVLQGCDQSHRFLLTSGANMDAEPCNSVAVKFTLCAGSIVREFTAKEMKIMHLR